MRSFALLALVAITGAAQALPILQINSYQSATGPITPMGVGVDLNEFHEGHLGGSFVLSPAVLEVERATITTTVEFIFPGAIMTAVLIAEAYNDFGIIEIFEDGSSANAVDFVFDNFHWFVTPVFHGNGDQKNTVFNEIIHYGDNFRMDVVNLPMASPLVTGSSVARVPEPPMFWLFVLGAACLVFVRRVVR